MGRRRRIDTRTPRSLRWHRLNAGLTKDELARRAHVSRATIGKLERGGRALALDREAERRVALALGVRLSEVTFGSVGDKRGARVDLAALRTKRKLSPGEVAEAADVPLKTVRAAESGVAIHPRYARRLADFYRCRVTDFYPAEREALAA